MFQASKFHLGIDVVDMHFFNFCDCKVCIPVPGWFPVPIGDGLELGFITIPWSRIVSIPWRVVILLGKWSPMEVIE